MNMCLKSVLEARDGEGAAKLYSPDDVPTTSAAPNVC